jgi:glutaconate CoA-transferase subunit A
MNTMMSLSDAIHRFVNHGDSVALEGFTHLIPFAAGHELIRQQKRDLHLIRMTPDVIYDQLIGCGAVRELTFSWGGNPGVGSLHRLRDAVERQWPQAIVLHEHSHAGMAAAYCAGAARLPFGVLRGYVGTDLPRVNNDIRFIECPYTGDSLATVPALNPDVTILHAQFADTEGNVMFTGIVGAAREAALAARNVIVTVEKIVKKLPAEMNSLVLPRWLIHAVCCVPGGAYPSYAHGFYDRDNAFYLQWDTIARERESFLAWINTYVNQTTDHQHFLRLLQQHKAA